MQHGLDVFDEDAQTLAEWLRSPIRELNTPCPYLTPRPDSAWWIMCWAASSMVLLANDPVSFVLTVYRTVKAKYIHELLATEGARLFGGRWNPKGYPLLYATSSPALALVES